MNSLKAMLETSTPHVSVVMPVYNGERFLREAIDSIFAQTYTHYELIIIDDGSTDGTAQIINSYADPRITRLKHSSNLGLITSLNEGILLAKGEYIARMDADDISLPERFSRQVELLDAHQEIGVAGTGAIFINDSGDDLLIKQIPSEHHLIKWYLPFFNGIIHPSVFIRRKILRQVGGYSAEYPAAEDRELWHRLSSVSKLCNLPELLIKYRVHEGSVSKKQRDLQLETDAAIVAKILAAALKRNIPLEAARIFMRQGAINLPSAQCNASLLLAYYRAFVSQNTLSHDEKLIIRKDAAAKLYDQANRWPFQMRNFIFSALVLDPSLSPRFLRAIPRRCLRRS